MSLREHLLAIRDERGRLDPTTVVEVATPNDHPLHDRFEWDDAVAAHGYRVTQAHELIRSVRLVYRTAADGEERDVRAFHAVRTEEGYIYESAEMVARDPFLTKLLLADMEREWKQLRERYQHFDEFWRLIRSEAA